MYLEFIVATTARPYELMTLLGSIKSQTKGNYKCHVVKKNQSDEKYDKIISLCKETIFGDYMRYSELDKNILNVFEGEFNLYGNFEYGLTTIDTDCEWVIMTNDDNYYSPKTVQYINEVVEKNPNVNLIYFDMLYNSPQLDSTGEYIEPYQYYKTSLEFGRNDLGCFVYKSDLSKNIKFDKIIPEADFYFLQEYINQNCQKPEQIEKINKALFIHN